MRKIKLVAFISLDGVTQAPGGPEEDTEGGFTLGGWTAPLFDEAVGQKVDAVSKAPFDLLLGRKTYDIFAGHWPKIENDPMADKLNGATKYVATSRPESLGWGPVADLGADIIDGVKRVKSEDGPDLLIWGSTQLAAQLLKHSLIDEIHLLVFPVLLGKGKRPFSDEALPREFKLIETKASQTGVVMNSYTLAGAVRTGSFALEE